MGAGDAQFPTAQGVLGFPQGKAGFPIAPLVYGTGPIRGNAPLLGQGACRESSGHQQHCQKQDAPSRRHFFHLHKPLSATTETLPGFYIIKPFSFSLSPNLSAMSTLGNAIKKENR